MAAMDHSGALAAATALLADYAACIDSDDLERWPEFFTGDARYFVSNELNHARGLPVGIIDLRGRDMMDDRVASLRRANIYEPQRYRHIVSVVRITGVDDGIVQAEASFMVVRTMIDGSQELFVSGRYLDKFDLSGPKPQFAEKQVILDSDKIDTLLAIPL